MLPVRNGPRLESHDAHSNVPKLCRRQMRSQRLHDPPDDLIARRFGCRTALGQDGAGNQPFAEPARKINFPDRLAQSTEDPGSGRVGQLALNPAPAKCHEDEEQRSSGTLGTPALNSQEMPEGRLVVGLTSRPARKLGVAGMGLGHHGFTVAVLVIR